MRAQDLMTSPAITCHGNNSLMDAAHKMWDRDIGALPVVNDEGKLTAIITDRDICMAAYTQGRALDELLVNSAMAMDVAVASPEASLREIEQLMARRQVRRIPIVDAAGKPLGIVSLNDIALACAQPGTAMKDEASMVSQTLGAICRHRGDADQKAA
jgi:CBS domain-containing protein